MSSMRRFPVSLVLVFLFLGCGGGGGGGGGGKLPTFPASPTVVPFQSSSEIGAPAYGYAKITDPEGGVLLVATNQVLVSLDEGYTPDDLTGLMNWISDKGGRVVGQVPADLLLQVELPKNSDVETALKELPDLPGVYLAFPNLVVTLLRNPTPDPRDTGNGYWITQIRADLAWDVTTGSPAVPIGMVDAGYDVSSNQIQKSRVEFVGPGGTGDGDLESHGTAVASLLAADGADTECSVGMSWQSPLLVADVFIQSRGHVLAMDVLRGIRATIDNGARAVNLSIGPVLADGVPGTNDAYRALRRAWREAMTPALREAAAKDTLLVWSAGNQGAGTDTNHQPGESDYIAGTTVKNDDSLLPSTTRDPAPKEALWQQYALIVAATDSSETLTSWSTAGGVVGISAPGESIYVGGSDGNCYTGSGTSFAAPLVTGTAALCASVDPTLTAADIRQILVDTARKPAGWDTSQGGAGILDADTAVLAASPAN